MPAGERGSPSERARLQNEGGIYTAEHTGPRCRLMTLHSSLAKHNKKETGKPSAQVEGLSQLEHTDPWRGQWRSSEERAVFCQGSTMSM